MPYFIAGNITNEGTPVSVPVTAISATSPAELLGSTLSDGSGDYRIENLDYYGPAIVIAHMDGGVVFSPNTIVPAGQIISPSIPNGYLYQATGGGTTGSVEPTWATSGTTTSGDVDFTAIQIFNPTAAGHENTEFYMPDTYSFAGRTLTRVDQTVIGGTTYHRYTDLLQTEYNAYFDGLLQPLPTPDIIPVNADFASGDLTGWTTTIGTPAVRTATAEGVEKYVAYGAATLEWGISQEVDLAAYLATLGYPADSLMFLFSDVEFTLYATQGSYNDNDRAQQTLAILDGSGTQLSAATNDLIVTPSTVWTERTVNLSGNQTSIGGFEITLYGYRLNGSNNDGYTTELRIVTSRNE